MRVLLRNPKREVTFDSSLRVHALLARLDIHRDTVLVIRNKTIVPGDELLDVDDVVEIRPVISGGAA
jgi:sulfur carrier protein